jgi:hypothetical protein
MRATRFLREVATTPYYRRHPSAVLQFAYAKWLFSRCNRSRGMSPLKTMCCDANFH